MAKLVRKKKSAPDDDVLPKTLRSAHLASEHKAADIRAYNVAGLTIVADSFVVCSAASEPQLKAICNNVAVGMKEVGVKAGHTEGNHASGWVVMDFGAVVLHVFRDEAREFYDLDGLWADAPLIELDLD